MYISSVIIENFRCFGESVEFKFNKGLTVLIGENDSGKTAVIDAIRYALGTTDQSWQRVEITDYYNEDVTKEIKITIIFSDLTEDEKAAFMECLTYTKNDVLLYFNWSARFLTNVNPNRTFINITCGKAGDVGSPAAEARELLRVTYLKPLRDAYIQMKSGRNSRLAQILSTVPDLNAGIKEYAEGINLNELSLTGIFDLSNHLLAHHRKIKEVNKAIDEVLKRQMLLSNDEIKTEILVANTANNEDRKIHTLLEKLDLQVDNHSKNSYGKVGLGTSNIMSMACELLLNQYNEENSSFMLIEEPEAHIHAQRQLKLIQSMQTHCNTGNQQVIITTHSPLLTSVVKLENLVLIHNHIAYSMKSDYTMLEDNDYKYLERYLDATKANLFFARGVLIVEGPGEELLLPTIATLLGRSLTDYGVSIVNVKSTGLRRYARIFQRKNSDEIINIPVACIADRDIMPDCAPAICINEEYADKDKWPKKNRRWKTESEIDDNEKYLNKIKEKADGKPVKTFIAEHWTLEYDLARSGLAEEMLNTISKIRAKELKECMPEDLLSDYIKEYNNYVTDEEKASYVYSFFSHKTISKAEFAQQFAIDLEEKYLNYKSNNLNELLPKYLVEAIEYVTSPLI